MVLSVSAGGLSKQAYIYHSMLKGSDACSEGNIAHLTLQSQMMLMNSKHKFSEHKGNNTKNELFKQKFI